MKFKTAQLLLIGLFVLAFYSVQGEQFLDYDSASTFAAQLMRKRLCPNGDCGPLDNRYSKENITKYDKKDYSTSLSLPTLKEDTEDDNKKILQYLLLGPVIIILLYILLEK
jgi:hypothetical protein